MSVKIERLPKQPCLPEDNASSHTGRIIRQAHPSGQVFCLCTRCNRAWIEGSRTPPAVPSAAEPAASQPGFFDDLPAWRFQARATTIVKPRGGNSA